ncbi:MAG: hypothetical protein R3Y08_00055 [Rikenellaceae bacterium]
MIRVTISGIECDLDASQQIKLKFESDSLADVESGRSGSTLLFRLPTTAANAEALGLEWDIHPQTKFNSIWHPMVVALDGVELFSGTAYLMKITWLEGKRYAEVECRGGVLSWATQAALTRFSKIGLDYSTTLCESLFKESWEDNSDVKFFPVVRDSYDIRGSMVNVTGLRVARSIDDYHPFFRCSALLNAIFESAGYSVESETMVSENFDKLYISGNYTSEDSSAALEAMGFYLKRCEECTTTTDSMGRVSLSPYDELCSVGNIVDIESLDSDKECYNRGNVMQIDGQALSFVPLVEISAGFEYFLHYTSPCQIESRTKLKGIDRLNSISDGYINWEITNRYIDQREMVVVGTNYKLMIFNFDSGERYRLVGVSQEGEVEEIFYTSIRMSSFTLSKLYPHYRLERWENDGYYTYTDDWAIYLGYVEESAPLEVEITVRSSPHSYSPLSPMIFHTQLLEGANAGVEFTLHKDSSVRPYFAYYPGYNAEVTFEELAQHSYTALELLSSLQHLFNLRFLTDEAAKKVVIESFDRFYTSQQWDWSARVVESEAIEFEDWAHTTHRNIKLGYQQSDGVVKRMGESDNKYFGEHSFSIDSYAASGTSQTLLNPFLCASTNDDNGVMVVGDRDDLEQINTLNFSPRIGRYFDIRQIDDENYSLPYVAFHDPQEEFTLCFEDRDGVAGLNRLYTRQMELLERGQLLSLCVRLSAFDYSNLISAQSYAPSCRDIFCFTLGGESFSTILHSIESYDLKEGVARCLFLTID